MKYCISFFIFCGFLNPKIRREQTIKYCYEKNKNKIWSDSSLKDNKRSAPLYC